MPFHFRRKSCPCTTPGSFGPPRGDTASSRPDPCVCDRPSHWSWITRRSIRSSICPNGPPFLILLGTYPTYPTLRYYPDIVLQPPDRQIGNHPPGRSVFNRSPVAATRPRPGGVIGSACEHPRHKRTDPAKCPVVPVEWLRRRGKIGDPRRMAEWKLWKFSIW